MCDNLHAERACIYHDGGAFGLENNYGNNFPELKPSLHRSDSGSSESESFALNQLPFLPHANWLVLDFDRC